ncbi:MAG TPA: T9SS type A sorting domain-containing protein [Draconibacterium sp.]|nr:T9SS type A sorting domain-containing protein [Draconibacterium sp.]
MKKIYTLILLAFSLGMQAQCPFINNIWARNDTAFVATSTHLYRTFDGGKSWNKMALDGAKTTDPREIMVSPGLITVATNTAERCYQSTNWGNSWNISNDGLDRIAGAPALVPRSSVTINNLHFVGGNNNLSYFDKAQNKWIQVLNGFMAVVRQIGVDTLLASTDASSSKTYISTNGGMNWTQLASEPKFQITATYFLGTGWSDAIKLGNRLFSCTNAGNYENLFYSDDLGQKWTKIPGSNSYFGGEIHGDRIILTAPDTMVMANYLTGIWRVTANGLKSEKINGTPGVMNLALWKGNKLLAGTTSGLVEIDNFGQGTILNKYCFENALTTAVKKINNNSDDFSFYPNPAQNEIHINSNEAVKLLNANGTFIRNMSQPVENISDLAPGLYFIISENGSAKKLLKQ